MNSTEISEMEAGLWRSLGLEVRMDARMPLRRLSFAMHLGSVDIGQLKSPMVESQACNLDRFRLTLQAYCVYLLLCRVEDIRQRYGMAAPYLGAISLHVFCW